MIPPPAPSISGGTSQRVAVERTEGGVRISQTGLEVLTASVTRRSPATGAASGWRSQWLQLVRELAALHRVAEDLGPRRGDLAARLGKAKEVAARAAPRVEAPCSTKSCATSPRCRRRSSRLRMVPLGVLFEQYPRMVRDLARELGKEVELTLEGEDTRVDRTVLEALKDPLLHLVRNAVDHGLEPREERVEAGKRPKGHLSLRGAPRGRAPAAQGGGRRRGPRPRAAAAGGRAKGRARRDAGRPPVGRRPRSISIFLPGFSSKDAVTRRLRPRGGPRRGAGAHARAWAAR